MARISTNPIDAEIAAARETIVAQSQAIRVDSPRARLAAAKRHLTDLEGRRRRERALDLALASDPSYRERLEAAQTAARDTEAAYEHLLTTEAQAAAGTIGGRTMAWLDMDRLGLDIQIADRERVRARAAFRNLKSWPDRLLAQADLRILDKSPREPESESMFSIPWIGRKRRERQDGAA